MCLKEALWSKGLGFRRWLTYFSCFSVLQCVAVCCNVCCRGFVEQRFKVQASVDIFFMFQRVAVCCNACCRGFVESGFKVQAFSVKG